MDHIVQFAIGVDDERIKQLIEETAAKQVAEDIKAASHGTKGYYTTQLNDSPERLKELFQEEIAKYVAEHADEVIQGAIDAVAKNMMHTKKVKAAIDELTKE